MKKVKVLREDGVEAWEEFEQSQPPIVVAPDPPVIMDGFGNGITVYVDDEELDDTRIEHLYGLYSKGIFHFRARSLADKLSAREGRFTIVPLYLQSFIGWGGIHGMVTGVVRVQSPRKSLWKNRPLVAGWRRLANGLYGVEFYELMGKVNNEIELYEVRGYAASILDVPWNWHYGLEIQGSIPMIP